MLYVAPKRKNRSLKWDTYEKRQYVFLGIPASHVHHEGMSRSRGCPAHDASCGRILTFERLPDVDLNELGWGDSRCS